MKLSEIKSNPNNPRLIKDDRFQKLVNSIKEFPKMMELRPMVVDKNNMVLGGNMRLKALRELKYKDIPDEWVKCAEDLTEEEQRRFIIADNVGFGDHDFDMLNKDFNVNELEDWGIDLPFFNQEQTDIEEVGSFNESASFTIKCDSINELEQLQTKLNTSGKKLSYSDFLIKAGL